MCILKGKGNRKREFGQLVEEEGIGGKKCSGNCKDVLLVMCDATLLPLSPVEITTAIQSLWNHISDVLAGDNVATDGQDSPWAQEIPLCLCCI